MSAYYSERSFWIVAYAVDLRPGDAGRGAAAMDEGILRVLIVSLGMTLVAIVVLGIGSLISRGKEPGMGVELAFITLIGWYFSGYAAEV